jgi:hypothetical protein
VSFVKLVAAQVVLYVVLNGVNENLPILNIFLSIWIKFGTGDTHKTLLSYIFGENRGSKRHTQVREYYFLSVISIFMHIPGAARSKSWVCGCSLAGIACSNPAGCMDACVVFAV